MIPLSVLLIRLGYGLSCLLWLASGQNTTTTPSLAPVTRTAAPTTTRNDTTTTTAPQSAPSPTATTSATPTTSPAPSFSTTQEPTSSTEVPTFSPRECWDNFTEVFFDLSRKLPFSTNTYVICPNRTYEIGYEYDTGDCCENGMLPIVCRANTHFKCGEDGKSTNRCILNGGSNHIVFNDIIFGEEISGAIVQGFTFRSPKTRTMVGTAPGDITFTDCILENQQNGGPILSAYEPFQRRRYLREELMDHFGDTPWERLEYVMRNDYLAELAEDLVQRGTNEDDLIVMDSIGAPYRELQGTEMLVMTFDQCVFQNCSQGDFGTSFATYGLITALTDLNVVNIKDCVFANNVYDGQTEYGNTGYAVSVLQTDLTMSNTCFLNNNFYGYGTVEIFEQSSYELDNNYVSSGDSDLKCLFAAYSDFLPTATTNITTCLEADATSCQASIYEAWLESRGNVAPTSQPALATTAPASRPTLPDQPTIGPTSSATMARALPLPTTPLTIVGIITLLWIGSL